MRPGHSMSRARWTTLGAACALLLGSAGLMTASAAVDAGSDSAFVPITPCRVMDTRPAPDTVGPRSTPLGAGETHAITVRGTNGNCTIPNEAIGLSLNVTAVHSTSDSFLTVFPADVTRPLASNLNWTAGQPAVPNAVTVKVSADGRVSFFNNGGTVDVVADIVGYYVSGHTTTETRVYTGFAAHYTTTVADLANGCVGTSNGAAVTATLDLGLPVGATITALHVRFNAVNNAAPFNIGLNRVDVSGTTPTAINASLNFVSQATGGPGSGQLTLTNVAPVSATSYYWLGLSSAPGLGSLAFCGAWVDFTMP